MRWAQETTEPSIKVDLITSVCTFVSIQIGHDGFGKNYFDYIYKSGHFSRYFDNMIYSIFVSIDGIFILGSFIIYMFFFFFCEFP